MRWPIHKLTQRLTSDSAWLLGLFARLAQLLACAAVSVVLASTIWRLFAPTSPPTPPARLQTLAHQSQHVAARHFFGIAAEKNAAQESQGARPTQQQPLAVRLLGTYVAPGKDSRALLAAEPHFSEVLIAHAGERLPSGHEVLEVHPDRVVLSKDGQRSELTLRTPSADRADESTAPPFGSNGPYPAPVMKDSR